ncbi:hypothetical protein ABZ783_30230 [Micromonospora sp. NPDC047738]
MLHQQWPHEQLWRIPGMGATRHRLIDLPEAAANGANGVGPA